jgi:hypothetical protein
VEPRRLKLIATVAIVGWAFFATIALLLPLVSEYSLTADHISELAVGRYGYLQIVAFFAAGFGTLALAWAVREATNGSWGSRLGSALMGLYGVGIILTGIFPTDEIDPAGRVVGSPTIAGTAHGVFGLHVGPSGRIRALKDLQARRSLASVLALVFGAGIRRAGRVHRTRAERRHCMDRVNPEDLQRDDHSVAGARGLPDPLHLQRCIDRAPLAGALGV